MIVAGEASGDAHAAALVHALRAAEPEVNFEIFGATGPLMGPAEVLARLQTSQTSCDRKQTRCGYLS